MINGGWAIGTGFYDNEIYEIINKRKIEVEKKNTKQLINIFIGSLVLIFILISFSFYISRKLKSALLNYQLTIDKGIEENRKKDKIISQQSKMAAMGEMIGNIAHQWRQPLNIISSSVSSLKIQKQFSTISDESLDTSVNDVLKATTYLSKTIDNFRDFYNHEKDIKKVCIESCFDKSFNLSNPKIDIIDINLITNYETKTIYAIENELIQVFINLINNSKDMFIKNKINEKIIKINTFIEKEYFKIEFIDNAGGIKKELLNRIFEPYFTTKHQAQGTGIGLYMSMKIIKQHLKGDIEASNIKFKYKNREFKGAKFLIKIKIFNAQISSF